MAEGYSAAALEAAIDRQRLGGPLALPLALCAMVMIIDGYDLSAMPLAVPHVMGVWGIEASGFGITLSAALVGLGAGALLLAPLGDRYGRRPLIVGSAGMLAVATIGTAWSGSIEAFAVWRLLTGLALGACLPNVTALVSELAPKRRRASMLVAVSCGISVGAVLAGLIVPWIVAWGGWPAIFTVCGGFTVLLAAALWYGLPESPRLLLERGDAGALERLTRRLKLDPASEDAPALPVAAMPAPRPSLLAPLTRHFRVATAVFVGLVTINAFNLYLLVSWLPTLLPEAGFTIDQAARLTAVVQFGGLAGGLLLSWFIDRSSTVKTLLVSYGLVILALLGFSLLPPTMIGWGGLLLIVGAGVAGGSLAIIAVGTSFYPPQLLSSALGIAIAVARLGAIAGPLGGGWLMARSAAPPTFMLVAIVPAAICAALVLLIPAARRRTDAGR